MEKYLDILIQGYKNYAAYLWKEVTFSVAPWYHNYFLWLLIVSLFFFILEWKVPWRAYQKHFRKDFWLDFFYMFFNFFLFSLIVYNAASDVVVNLFKDALAAMGIHNLLVVEVQKWSLWGHLLLGFVVRDFVQWWIHRLLHWSPRLWEFHKVHHSVEEMGFAAQLRYHWMENIIYRTLEYIPLALIGIGLRDFFIIHIFALTVGHFNHANISVSGRVTGGVIGFLIGLILISSYQWATLTDIGVVLGSSAAGSILLGPYMKYIFNSPEMHIWHHAYDLPPDKPYGINFGLTLSIWDWIFKTAHMPHSGRDIRLGFPGIEEFPKTFVGQNLHGLSKRS
ncbi:MAG TPA: fatty acid hydroxylase family protein [Phaeodactylibacter sp.]|nr:fatty acid hydroxylase family protein [Phaeodactylibacter sp.]